MKKIRLFCLVTGMLIVLSACNSEKANTLPEKKPEQFNFHIKYGIGGKNEVDNFQHKIVKDLIADGVATAENFSFTEEEMESIYRELREANVLEDKDLIKKDNCHQTPYSSYYLKVQIDGKEKEYEWSDENCSMTRDAEELTDVVGYIRDIVVKTDAYKRLPAASGGYD
ncbi:hypothetical protein [Pseudalkalibacillus caeni]|uniref:Lipoprotein n=1 Tax=Exobacillus caeni TaxID=2574798 RepID=A0A5R9F0X1_9BACL|nr:hypothetical protein [Pseudalkalibacillus caeni]TLS36070.1 hypothetical protein FCL54_16905 [Pseudalkalibacillus caeni]